MQKKDFLIGLLVTLCLCPPVFAEKFTGKCGENTTYSFDTETKTLTISGTGSISLQEGEEYAPWTNLPDTIRYIVVEDGVGFPEYPCFEHCGYVLKPVYNSTTFYFLPHEYVYSSGEIIEDFLPEGLKYIAPYACYSNSIGGIDLVIPEGYEEIGDYAFYYTEIPKVVLPETMKKIGAYAFSSLGEINIPESLEEVGEHTFDNYPGWTPLYNSKIFFHYPYNGDDRYTIPDGIEKIADNAFSNSKNITEINFPSSVKEIGDNAFGNCTYLEHIELPASLESIGDGAFYGCNLRSLALPDNVTSIGTSAFSNCDSLTEVTLPANLKSIPGYAFYSCDKLQKAVLPEGLERIEKEAFGYCYALTDINFPMSINYIGPNGVNAAILTPSEPIYTPKVFIRMPTDYSGEYTVPEGIDCIYDYAFSSCQHLSAVHLPNSLKDIRTGAFQDCDLLTSIALPEGVTRIGTQCFSNCDGLSSVNLPGTLEIIDLGAFSNCNQLQSIVIPASVDSIYNEAFYACSELFSATIESPDTWLGDNVFYGCYKLQNAIVQNDTYFQCPKDATEVIVPEGIKHIADYAFENCSQLSSVVLPESLETIGIGAFKSCTSLNEISLPENVEYIGSYAFNSCSSLSEIVIPEKVDTLHNSIFMNCSNLTSIQLPNRIKFMGQSTFEGCTSLEYITLPDSLKDLDGYNFYGCTSLTEIKLSDAITNLEGYTLSETQLTHVQLPANVKTISDDAFNDCNKLSSLSIAESNTSFDTYKGILYNEGMTEIKIIPQGITEMDLPETLDIEEVFSSHSHDLENFPNLRTLTLRACDQPLYHLFSNFDYDSTAYYYNQKGEDGVTRDITEYHYGLPDNLEKLVLYCDSFSTQLYNETINRYGDIYRRITHLDGIDTVEIHATTYFDPTALNGLAKTVKAMIFDGINILPSNCFAEMDSLQSLTITQAQTMEAGCMANLVNLKELTLPYAGAGSASTASSFGELFSSVANDKMQRVVQFLEDGTSVTYYVPLIEKLTLTEGLTTLPYGALYNCSMLQQVTLPSSLYMVGDKAFYGCAGLTDIYCKGAEPASAYSGTFDGVRVNSCVLHVPYNASEMYRRSTGWEKFYYIEEEAPISITVIKNIENAGVIYGLQEYQLGETAELQAVANSGYTFSGWTENGEMISEESTYTFTVEGDRSLIAVFTPVSGSNDVSTTPGSNQVSFTWTAEEGASTYRLDVFTDEAMTQLAGSLLFDANGQIIKRAVSTTLTATIDGLSPLTNYYYRMTAFDETEQAISQYTGTFSTTQATGLEADGEISAVSVQTRQDGVEICHAEGLQVRIVNASGMTVTSLTADSDSMNIPLEKGFYIVVVGNSTYKIMI